MAKSNSKRKTRSDKFPLTLHPTGQYCKKIKGKLYYFGTDKKIALQRYLEQASHLHAGRQHKTTSSKDDITIGNLCNLYLEHQNSKVQFEQLTADHHRDQLKSLRMLVLFLGQHRLLSEISTLDLQNFKKKLLKSYSSAHRVNLNIGIMKAMFHWARKNEVVENIPNIDAISKVKVVQKDRPTFSAKQIEKLLNAADAQMKAMVLLGLNCGFGCTDCAQLTWRDIDLESTRVRLPRNKTGIARNLPLWPETVHALTALPRRGDLIFYTRRGNPCVRTTSSVGKDGIVKYTSDNYIAKKFSKLKKAADIKTEKGVGFYTLRRTAATLAARSGDPFAVQKLLGHADLKMATTYVQDVSEQTDLVVNNVRKLIIQGDS